MRKTADRILAAERFVEEWEGRGQEDEHDETFWNQFLQEVMGIGRVHHIIDYQKKVKVDGTWRRIDAKFRSEGAHSSRRARYRSFQEG